MSKYDKLLEKLLDHKTVIKFQELEYLLGQLGYIEKKTGETSGSRKAYINEKSKHIIRIHKPHPGNELKKYVKDAIVAELQKMKLV
ncbi:MAG: type II toxin-antitoxin system HicA family toxin [Anditalea sp.]